MTPNILRMHQRSITLAFLVSVVFIVGINGLAQTRDVHVVDANQNMKSLINRLNDTIIKPNHGDVTFYLATTIEGLNKIVIPDYRGQGSPFNYIEEVGDDYVCIGYAGGGVDGISCIPY